jgi:hypothetical protein
MVSLPSLDSEIGPEPEEDGPYHDQTLWEQARWRTGHHCGRGPKGCMERDHGPPRNIPVEWARD